MVITPAASVLKLSVTARRSCGLGRVRRHHQEQPMHDWVLFEMPDECPWLFKADSQPWAAKALWLVTCCLGRTVGR
jgi:hypothetical protein